MYFAKSPGISLRPVIAVDGSVVLLRAFGPSSLLSTGAMSTATEGQCRFDAASMSVDDGATIIRPNDIVITSPGRWLKIVGGGITNPIPGGLTFDQISSMHVINAESVLAGTGIHLGLMAGSAAAVGPGGNLYLKGGTTEADVANGGELVLEGGTSLVGAARRGGMLTIQGGKSFEGPGGHILLAGGDTEGIANELGEVWLGPANRSDSLYSMLIPTPSAGFNRLTAPGIRFNDVSGIKHWEIKNPDGIWVAIPTNIIVGQAYGVLVAGSAVAMFLDKTFGPIVSGGTAGQGRCAGLLMNSADVAGAPVYVQYFGESLPIEHTQFVPEKPLRVNCGAPVYIVLDTVFTMTLIKPTTACTYQEIGTVCTVDDTLASDTTTILISLQTPVVIPAM